jgi:uncharacterized glyoxalase superfamily protein PhnB
MVLSARAALKSIPLPAVGLGAGCMWIDAYDAVATKAGRYVQEGGCTAVADWQDAFWGKNYSRVASVKKHYDPTNVFKMHDGVAA